MSGMRVTLTVTVDTATDEIYMDHEDLARNVAGWIIGGLYDRSDITNVEVVQQQP